MGKRKALSSSALAAEHVATASLEAAGLELVTARRMTRQSSKRQDSIPPPPIPVSPTRRTAEIIQGMDTATDESSGPASTPAPKAKAKRRAHSKAAAAAVLDAPVTLAIDQAQQEEEQKDSKPKKKRKTPALKQPPAADVIKDAAATPAIDDIKQEEQQEDTKPKKKRKTRAVKQAAAASDAAVDHPPAGCCCDDDELTVVEVTPAKTPKPKRKSKATIGQEVAGLLATRGDVDASFLLYDTYPHSRDFQLTADGSNGTSTPAPTRPLDANLSSSVTRRMNQSVYSTVLTYHFADGTSSVQTTVTTTQLPGQQDSSQGADVLSDSTVSDDGGVNKVPDPPVHATQHDTEELPTPIKELVLSKADSIADKASVPEAIEDVPPLVPSSEPLQEEEAPEFNKQLRNKPWPKVVPNLGYACLCATLRAYDVYCSRDCNQKTFLDPEKGVRHISTLALANARDLGALIRWNARHGIQLFRMSSGIFPWMTKYKAEDLPDFPAIKQALFEAGEAARAAGQRLTFHPSEFCKIAGPEERDHWTEQSVQELEVHSQIFDLMGYEPSHWNKINIHVGAVYGDKDATIKRFAKVVNEKLSPACKARLTVENDDKASMYSVKDLLVLHDMCGIPITFDFHHHKFCTGDWDEKTAFEAAIATWPKGVRPVVHWSEAGKEAPRAPAHSDYVYGPIYLHGHEAEVDVMIESKAKELALLRYRELAIKHLSD